MNSTYSRDGLTVTEIEAFTSLNSPKLELMTFEVIVNGEKRIDTLESSNDFQKNMIEYISSFDSSVNRSETYYSMIK